MGEIGRIGLAINQCSQHSMIFPNNVQTEEGNWSAIWHYTDSYKMGQSYQQMSFDGGLRTVNCDTVRFLLIKSNPVLICSLVLKGGVQLTTIRSQLPW